MKSRINLDVDYKGQPEIKIEHIHSDDIRDKTLSILMNNVNWPDGYNKINTFHEIPKGVFVIKERYEAMHLGYGQKALQSDGKCDRVDTYTLVPLNRIEFKTNQAMLQSHINNNDDELGFYSIRQAVDRVKDLYVMLGLDTLPIDYIESILNAVPGLKNKLNEFSLTQYTERDISVLRNLYGLKDPWSDKCNYVLSPEGPMHPDEYEEKYLGIEKGIPLVSGQINHGLNNVTTKYSK